MVFQVKEENRFDNQENKGTILCERGYPEYTFYWTPELVIYCGPVVHSEVDVDLKCIMGLQSQMIDFTNDFVQEDIPSGDPVFIELPRYLKSDGGQYDIVIRLKKSLYGQA